MNKERGKIIGYNQQTGEPIYEQFNINNDINNQIIDSNKNINPLNFATMQFQDGVNNDVVEKQKYVQDDNSQIQTTSLDYQQLNDQYSNSNNSDNFASVNLNKSRKNKFIWLSLGLLLIVSAILISLFSTNFSKSNRVFMIYMVGSDLESENSLATADLEDLIPENIDLENNKVVLMIGGSETWHNFVDEKETAIYELTDTGFKKVKKYNIQNMGSSQTLEKFLTYVYRNYRSENYDLIFWNHGLGATAFEKDTLAGDYITLDKFSSALENSPFNEKNKMESIIFITCLSGNLHFASVIDDYAEYMVATEEVSWASPSINKLNFIEKVEVNDDGKTIGQKFIDNVASVIEQNSYTSHYGTYSVIDLSKINNLERKLNEFVESIDVEKNYKTIANIRGNLNQYGIDSLEFDTVDLYSLVSNLKNLSSDKADELLKSLDDAVVYNRSKNNYSKGLSIYFPFNANNGLTNIYLKHLSKVNKNSYLSFITKFTNIKTMGSVGNWSSMNSNISAKKGDFSLQLTDEEKNNYSRANYTVYRDMGDGYYMPIYQSSDVNIDETGKLTAKYKGKALKIINNSDNSSETILLIEKERFDDYQNYFTFVSLNSYNENDGFNFTSAYMNIVVNGDNPNGKIDSIIKTGKDAPSMAMLNLKDYQDLYFMNYKYKILDSNGNYTEDWQSSGVAYMFRTGTKDTDYTFTISNLDDDYKYYCVFKVYDIYNNYHYSNLIRMN